MAVVVHKPKFTHTHPLAIDSKLSLESKKLYKKLVENAGVWGASVQTVDNLSSTRVNLNGKTPALHDDALMDHRCKKDIIKEVKTQYAPLGLGYLVTSFEVDHTFKRVLEYNEWEIVIYCSAVHQAVTIGCVYTNGQDRKFYKKLFDMLQDIVGDVTSKPMHFKALTPGGNLLCINTDLEAAQSLGFGDSFISTNQLDYSGIPASIDTKSILSYILKSCHVHVKQAILNFRKMVSHQDYQKILDFLYLKPEDLPVFDKFIEGHGILKIKSK
ncbi:hypothetical protein BDQ17DRAFT_1427713 [Cyathus striatus]|nr:hypothetical protein BDQ17DRAFT_1427713 [Cyathus striatus]